MARPNDNFVPERTRFQQELDEKLRDMDRVPVPDETFPFLTMYEACALARCSRDTIERAIRHGHLKACLINHEYRGKRFAREDVVEWIKTGMRTKPAPAPAAAE